MKPVTRGSKESSVGGISERTPRRPPNGDKVKDLDWYEVEARCKTIFKHMLEPYNIFRAE